MLSKEVCMQCVNSFAEKWGKWSEIDDMAWGSEGRIACPFRADGARAEVSDPPPPGCHKMLEQAVAAGIVEKKDA